MDVDDSTLLILEAIKCPNLRIRYSSRYRGDEKLMLMYLIEMG